MAQGIVDLRPGHAESLHWFGLVVAEFRSCEFEKTQRGSTDREGKKIICQWSFSISHFPFFRACLCSSRLPFKFGCGFDESHLQWPE